MANPSQACTSSHPLDIYGLAVTIEFVVIRSRNTNSHPLARGAANRNKQSYSLQQPPAIRFYPQRLPTTHVPSQDNHAAGVREVSEHTVCLVFHSQVAGHCTLIPLAIAARALLNY